MLLRRIRHHIGQENWFAVFVDFVIVVVGVYVGIEVSNWNEARQEDARAREYLERIQGDLVFDRTEATNRREFWGRVIDFGEAAIAHAESGELHQGSVAQTVLAYYQASQVDPYSAVSTTYDELKASGELRLIRDPALRAQLADYYVDATSLQAEHLFQFIPRYREYVRGVMPYAVQQYIWRECHETAAGGQKILDCEPPIEAAEGDAILESLAGDPEVVRGLRFWISNLVVATLVIDDNLGQIEKLLQLVNEAVAAK